MNFTYLIYPLASPVELLHTGKRKQAGLTIPASGLEPVIPLIVRKALLLRKVNCRDD